VNKTKSLLLLSFALVFIAGAAIGRLMAPKPESGGDRRSWLTEELQLSVEQRERMEEIWSEVMGRLRSPDRDQRREMAAERDQAVMDLLSEEQRAQYGEIHAEFDRKMDELSEEREAAFHEAVEKTKQILTPEQRVKYEELLTRMRERDRRRPFGAGRRGRRGPDNGPVESIPDQDPVEQSVRPHPRSSVATSAALLPS
jgi:Spy/CpxP family protein refolding chaperone